MTVVRCKWVGFTGETHGWSYFNLFNHPEDNTIEAWEKEYGEPKGIVKERIAWLCPK